MWKVGRGGVAPVRQLTMLRDLLLEQRGIVSDDLDRFFEPRYERDVHDPFLLSGMHRAVERIFAAITARERIVVHGDYDVDGITGAAVLVEVLRGLGAQVTPYVPHRLDEGYGLSLATAQTLSDELDLLVTVDCGISNHAEIAWLQERGKDVIVVDHHTLPDTPPRAYAVLHPGLDAASRPLTNLSGVGVAWKFASALLSQSSGGADRRRALELLDLVCLGTIADMVPLLGENRALVSFGLRILQRTSRPGLRALLAAGGGLGASLDATFLSFRVIPLLNAAGRMQHAQPALDLLLSTDEHQAATLVAQLRSFNNERRSLSRRILREAEQRVVADHPVIVVADTAWQPGVLGLVAGKLSERYGRPAVAVGGHNGTAIGSARSPEGINVLDILSGARQHLLRVGGHARAAGFSLKPSSIDSFHQMLLDQVSSEVVAPRLDVFADAVLHEELITSDTVDLLARFAPYGMGNAQPVFVGRRFRLRDWRPVGRSGEHAKCTFSLAGRSIGGIGFGLVAAMEQLADDLVDVLFHLEMNEFRGVSSLQLRLDAIAPSGSVPIVESL